MQALRIKPRVSTQTNKKIVKKGKQMEIEILIKNKKNNRLPRNLNNQVRNLRPQKNRMACVYFTNHCIDKIQNQI